MSIISDPNTGLYIDNVTGQVYMDPGGEQLSTNPDLNSQAQRNMQIANRLFANYGADQARYRQVFSDQAELARGLDRVIRGSAPSVAEMQLQEGVEAGRRSAESMAAGATGANAPLARYAAITSAGDQAAEANAAGARARVEEVANATRTKAGVLGQMGTEANQSGAINVQGATAAGQTAEHATEKQAEIDQREREKWMNFTANLINAGGNAATLYALRSPSKPGAVA
jgi:hypothetical protein